MKWYKKLLSEVAQPTSEDEINFKEKHIIDHILDPNAEEHQFTADEIKKFKNRADYEKGEDIDVYESIHRPHKDAPEFSKRNYHEKMSESHLSNAEDLDPKSKEYVMHINASNAHKAAIKKIDTPDYRDTADYAQRMSKNANAMHEGVDLVRDLPGQEDDDVNNDGKVDNIDKHLKYKRHAEIKSKIIDENSSFKSLVSRLVNNKLRSEGLEPITPAGGDFDEDESHQNYKKSNMSTKLPAIGDNLNQEGVDLKKDKKGLKVFVEAYSHGSLKLSDNSSVSLTNEDAKVLNSLFNGLNDKNKSKMENTLKSNKKGFNEILSFAKETYNG